MHIPDSVISPATCVVAGTAMVPVWYAAGHRLREGLATRQVPLLAIGAAFCFTIMMFNIPVPGGTTVHPVGGVLLAVLLGPWAAVIGMTVVLVIQALFFGDGGIFAFGANCFTMAFAMPVCGYVLYRMIAAQSRVTSIRRALAAGIGSYAGLNVAALLTAILLGLQPVLYHDSAGHALYFPFGLRVTIPAIVGAHLAIAGVAEAVVATLVVRHLQATGIPLYITGTEAGRLGSGRRELLWIWLAALAALSPFGILAKGDAWGEWGAQDLKERAGYMPAKVAAADVHAWQGYMPDYLSDRGKLGYICAAGVGVLSISAVLLVAGRVLLRRDEGTGMREQGSVATARLTPDRVRPGHVPDWMMNPNPDSRLPAPRHSGRAWSLDARLARNGFLDKTLNGLADGVREAVVAETWARQDGLLQRLDPRVKILGLLGFVVVTSMLHRLPTLLAAYGLLMVLVVRSRLPLGLLLRRVWLGVPLFVGAVTLPSALNVVTPGRPLLVLLSHPYLAVTEPGLFHAGILTLRVAVAVSFAVVLTLTTRWNDLLRGLRVLLAPKPFLTVLTMTYRYLAVLMQAATEMFTARKSRMVGRVSAADDRRFVVGAIGALFGKTLALTEDVHAAMLSRGWTGEAQTLRPLRLEATDLLWMAAMILAAAVALGGEHLG